MYFRRNAPDGSPLPTTTLRESGLALFFVALCGCGASATTSGADSEALPSQPPMEADAMESAGEAEEPLPAKETAEQAPQIDENGELLVDDLEDGDQWFELLGVAGEWFTYADGTAEVSPPDHGGVGNTPGEIHVSGEGFTGWGVGLAAYFQYADLSAFQGVKVRLKGTGTVKLEVSTPATLPLDHDGVCEDNCYRHFSKFIRLPAEYEDVTILFSELTQPGAPQVEFSLDQVGQIDFLTPVSGGAPAAVDLWVDRLSLVGAEQ